MYITEKEIKGRTYRFLCADIDGKELTLGYIDNFGKVHFYTSK